MSSQNFVQFASEHKGEEVEVITSQGTYTGTLEYAGSDHIIIRSRIRGRIVRLAIRVALIVGLFRLIGRGNPL
ncbi:hypothetical protein [Metabacillus sp. RGM 3146]|uniref:hypothetical protein n=1 Tax=Metabacillus sp. RGM 3146 TaxID=3401092 RepID=UPI003B9A9F02